MRTTRRRHELFHRGRAGLSRADVLTMIFCGTILPLLTMAWIGCGLLGPSETEQRQKCMNNLKQLGLAMHNVHDTDKFFPPGSTSRASWPAYILPFIDQYPIYQDPACDPRSGTDPVVAAGTVNSATINLFLCPANVEATNFDGEITYIGISGRQAPRDKMEDRLRGVFRDESYDRTTGEPKTQDEDPTKQDYKGWSIRGNYFRFRDAVDGTSLTLMFTETTRGGIHWASPYDPTSNTTMVWANETTNLLNKGGPFASRHPGGAFFGLVDGSAEFIPDKIDPNHLLAFLTSSGGEGGTVKYTLEELNK